MLSYHGWFEIFGHWLEEKEWDYDEDRIADEVRTEAKRLSQYDNVRVDVIGQNGTWNVIVNGAGNRKRGEFYEVIDLVHRIAEIAPGAFGVLYVQDGDAEDESVRDIFQCYVMRKGVVEIMPDPFFSPRIATVG